MWRTYTGTFTPKRKSSAAVHSSRADGLEHAAASSSSAHPKHRPATLPRRSSSLDLEELIQQVEAQQQQISGRVSAVVEHETEQPVDEPPPPQQREKEEEEEEETSSNNNNSTHSAQQHHQQPRHWANSVFVDPTAPSIGASISSAHHRRASPPALFVEQKQSQQQVSSSINQLPVPSPTNSEREEGSAASVDGGQRQTPPQQQRSSSMPPVMDGGNDAEATTDQNAKNDRKSANENADANKSSDNASMFERCDVRNSDRPAPTMPTTDGIEYPRAASWSASTVAEIMRDSIGRKVFCCFLHGALAEENLLFVEEVEKLKKEKQPERIRNGVQALLDKYASYINLSAVAMTKLRECANAETPDPKSLDFAHKEIYKLLENDQFPRFRRSPLYVGFLEQLLPRSYAERWTTSFDALLGNQVGRHHFRQFLFNVRAEENLRFWESVIEYRQLRNKSTAMQNMGRTIQQQFLREGAHNEVFLPFGLRQRVEKKIREKDADETLFDESVKHVELILKNDPYVRFLQSKEYNDLLAKLH